MSHSNYLGKCTQPHDDLGSDFEKCPLFDTNNPSAKSCGACGCLRRFHERPTLDSRYVLKTLLVTDSGPGVANRKMKLESISD
jgi:hypothetical protein